MSTPYFFFWPQGVIYFIAGGILSELAGYAYHRWILHAILLFSDKFEDGRLKRLRYLFVPWKVAYDKHMWHHYVLFPEPDAPKTQPKPFRPRHVYYMAPELSDHVFGRERSENATFDRIEYLLRKVGMIASLDWLIIAAVFWVVAYLILGYTAAFAYFLAGGLLIALLNQYVHDSFHVMPYPKLSMVPWKNWFRPAVFIANMGEHLPVIRRYYRYIFRRHLAHHYQVMKIDDANYRYRGALLNVETVNFTIFNPIPDIIFSTFSAEVYQEI